MLPTRPAAFVFDLDGTLVDSGRDIALSANATRRRLGLDDLPLPVLVGYVGDGVAKLLERALGHDPRTGLPDLPVAPERHAEAMAAFAEHYGRHLLDHTRPYPGVRRVLEGLADLPLAVATNKPRAFTDAILAGLGLADRFARVVGGDEAPARKPDPAHLAAALAGLDVAPARVVMVGDSPNDVLAARAFGAASVGCTYGLAAPERVRAAGPDALLDAFADLPGLFPVRGA